MWHLRAEFRLMRYTCLSGEWCLIQRTQFWLLRPAYSSTSIFSLEWARPSHALRIIHLSVFEHVIRNSVIMLKYLSCLISRAFLPLLLRVLVLWRRLSSFNLEGDPNLTKLRSRVFEASPSRFIGDAGSVPDEFTSANTEKVICYSYHWVMRKKRCLQCLENSNWIISFLTSFSCIAVIIFYVMPFYLIYQRSR